jgi:PPOX class probable F420-dependent enzyme
VHLDPGGLPPEATEFLAERHLATLTTLRGNGSPHVVPVGFTWDAPRRLVRVIAGGTSRKVAHVRAGGDGARAVVCQVDGARWLSLEGRATVTTEPPRVADAVARYAERYREPRPNPTRVAIEIAVDRVLGSVPPGPRPSG